VLQASVEGDSLCLDLFGVSCISIPDGGSLEQADLASWGTGAGGDYSCSFGPLFREVEAVTVEFADGTVLERRIIPGQGWATNFYVACIEADSRVSEVVLLDADGARLESVG